MKLKLTAALLCVVIFTSAQKPASVPLNKKAFTLMRFFEKNHYLPIVWNDSTSSMLFDHWMKTIDEKKLIFTEADINSFEKYRYLLDDEIKGSSWSFIPLFEKTALLRFHKIDSLVNEYLGKPIDFSKSDDFIWPFATYAKSEQEAASRYQHYLKWGVINKIKDNLSPNDSALTNGKLPQDFAKRETAARTKMLKRENDFFKNISQDISKQIGDEYLDCIAWCYDPHSNYMNIQAKKEFETEMSAFAFSVGMDVQKNDDDNNIIAFIDPGGSAWRSGKLHTGDQLLKISSENKSYDASDLAEDEIDNLLGGNKEEPVEVTIKTATGEVLQVKLMKEKISDDDNKVKSYVLYGTKNIGYINLPGFYSRAMENENALLDGCASDVSKEIVKLKKDTIAGLVLDLRYNGGGSMWEAIQLAGIFIDAGPLLSEKDKNGKVTFHKDPNRGTIYDGPLMVLINGGSASASELLSAVLQDYNRAIIVGGVTYGKGTAQVVLPMDTGTTMQTGVNEDFVKITQEKFYRINGSTTQWKGVFPDISFPDMYDEEEYKERFNKSALLPDNSKVGLYTPLPALPVSSLKAKSEARVAADPYFTMIKNLIEKRKMLKNGRRIPLQWKEFILHNKEIMEMYGDETDKVDSSKKNLFVRNNSFDQQRMKLSSDKTNGINSIYVNHIIADSIIQEAYTIMMDWVK